MVKFGVKNLGALLCFFFASSNAVSFSDLANINESLDVYLLRDTLCPDKVLFREGVLAIKSESATYLLHQHVVDSLKLGMHSTLWRILTAQEI